MTKYSRDLDKFSKYYAQSKVKQLKISKTYEQAIGEAFKSGAERYRLDRKQLCDFMIGS